MEPPNRSSGRITAAAAAGDLWLDDACLLDMDHFAKTLGTLKSQGARPDLLGSIISHYAGKYLPELSGHDSVPTTTPSPHSSTARWLKKRFIVETLTAMLPLEKDAAPCDFVLRLLRAASMAGAEAGCIAELEDRAAQQLEEATLEELMIPAFSHKSGTLLNVGLVIRLVQRFVGMDEAAKGGAVAVMKVARLVDGYLAEAALDVGLTVVEFEELARAVPGHARVTDDALYGAIDTYLKVHSTTITKQERKSLFKLLNTGKLSTGASLHASQNDRLPVRSVIQVLFSEQAKISRSTADCSASFNSLRSPNPALPGCVPSKRETVALQQEMRKLRDDVARLQLHCHALQSQVERLSFEKRRGGFFRWTGFLFGISKDAVEESSEVRSSGRQTPMVVPKKRRSKWRNSLS